MSQCPFSNFSSHIFLRLIYAISRDCSQSRAFNVVNLAGLCGLCRTRAFFLSDLPFAALLSGAIAISGAVQLQDPPALSALPWLEAHVIERFNRSSCQEKRTWEEISRQYASTQWRFSSGELGPLSTNDFHVCACFQNHPCAQAVSLNAQNDSMCYVYHETEERWIPWDLQQDLHFCQSQSANSSKISENVAPIEKEVC
jgi:hypothetical protein